MKLSIHGGEHRSTLLDLFHVTIGEARAIKSHTGLSIAEWRTGLMTLDQEDPDVLAGLVVLLTYRAGRQIDMAELESLDTQQLIATLEFEDSDVTTPATPGDGQTEQGGSEDDPDG